MMIVPIFRILPSNGQNDGVRITTQNSSEITIVDGHRQPRIDFTTTYTDETGETHIAKCKFEGLSFRIFAERAPPQWIGGLPDNIKHIKLASLPVNYFGEWHCAPGPQWVVTLSGAWSQETTSGDIVVMNAGDLHYDQDSDAKKMRPNQYRIGHISRTVGNEPCVQLIIQLERSINYICLSLIHISEPTRPY